jgi:hypothetical protein
VEPWSRRYRQKTGDGSFPGTGPAVYQDRVYFTDNTFPVYIGQGSYSLFEMDVFTLNDELKTPITSQHYRSSPEMDLLFPPSNTIAHYLTMNKFERPNVTHRVSVLPTPTSPGGFMFWSVSIVPPMNPNHPDNGSAIVWDSATRTVQARSLTNISHLHWQITQIGEADCITSLPDKGQLYMTDYDKVGLPTDTNHWLGAVTGDLPQYKTVNKYFLIVDSATGHVLVNKTLTITNAAGRVLGQGINPTLLVPGKNNDVFIGSQSGIIRVHLKSSV